MMTVRNPTDAKSLTVRAGEDLQIGMLVKLAAPAAAGSPPKVLKATDADMADATVFKAVVDFIAPDSQAVDFLVDPATSELTVNAGSDAANKIPSGAQCTIWFGKPVLGFHSSAVDASLDFSTITGTEKLAFLAASGKLAKYNSGAANTGAEVYQGFVYQNEGPELTVVLTEI